MKKSLLLVTFFLLPTYVWSVPITFDLRTLITESDDDVTSLSLNQGGLTATLSANTGVINRTSRAVGINSSCDSDNTDELDSACADTPSERLSVSFNQSVIFQNFVVSGLTRGDTGILVIEQDTDEYQLQFSATGLFSPVIDVPLLIAAGQTFYIQSLIDNNTRTARGFSFDSFTVDTLDDVVSVSEPEILSLLILGVVLLGINRDFFLKSSQLLLLRRFRCAFRR